MTGRILPMFALLLAIGLFFGYISPLWNGQIAAAKAGIAQDDQALLAAQQYVQRENELAAARNAIDPAALAKLGTFLPDSVDNVGLILDLDALAARSGLSLSSVDVAAPATSGAPASLSDAVANPVGSIDLSLSAVGSYGSLEAFLAGIEQSARLLDVRDLTVNGATNGVYTYQLILRLYWLR